MDCVVHGVAKSRTRLSDFQDIKEGIISQVQFSSVQFSHSVVSDSVTPWTVALEAPLSMGILQARVLKWVAMPSSRGSSQPRD